MDRYDHDCCHAGDGCCAGDDLRMRARYAAENARRDADDRDQASIAHQRGAIVELLQRQLGIVDADEVTMTRQADGSWQVWVGTGFVFAVPAWMVEPSLYLEAFRCSCVAGMLSVVPRREVRSIADLGQLIATHEHGHAKVSA